MQQTCYASTPHISLHGLIGNTATETLRINGTCTNKDIIILIGGGIPIVLFKVVC